MDLDGEPTLAYRGAADPAYLKELETAWNIRYVYVLKNRRGEVLYVGRSHHPFYRLAAHRQKGWWPQTYSADVWKLVDTGEYRTISPRLMDILANQYEQRAIVKLRPRYNKSGRPQRAQIA